MLLGIYLSKSIAFDIFCLITLIPNKLFERVSSLLFGDRVLEHIIFLFSDKRLVTLKILLSFNEISG
jgi:hypothetical protein